MNNRILVLALIGLLAFAGAYFYLQNAEPQFYGGRIQTPLQVDDFSLQSAAGPVRLSDFRGKIVVIYYGYTTCPDVCPTTLANLRLALNELGDAAQDVQVLFITVDPARDNLEKVTDYARAFRPDFIGLTGDDAEIARAARAFGIFYKLNEPDPANGFYTVDHTSTTLVLNRAGQWTLNFPYGLPPQEIASDLRNLLRE
jgi:protein SCO1